MEIREILSWISLCAVIICIIWIKDLIKSMPKLLKSTLLENHKAELQRQNEKVNIEYSEIQQYKVNSMIEMLNYMNDIIDSEKVMGLLGNLEKAKEINNELNKYGNKLMLFASDDTIKRYIDFRECGKAVGNKEKYMEYFSKFVLALRKDVGYSETKITESEYLSLWSNKSKEEIEEELLKNGMIYL